MRLLATTGGPSKIPISTFLDSKAMTGKHSSLDPARTLNCWSTTIQSNSTLERLNLAEPKKCSADGISAAGEQARWSPGDSPEYVFDEVSAAVLGRDETGLGGGVPFSFMNESASKLMSFQFYIGPTGSGAPVHC